MVLEKRFTNDNGEEEIWREYKLIQNDTKVVGDKGHYEQDEEDNEVFVVDYKAGYTEVEGFLTPDEVEYIKATDENTPLPK